MFIDLLFLFILANLFWQPLSLVVVVYLRC